MAKKITQSTEYLDGISAWSLFKETGKNEGNPHGCLSTEWYEFNRGWCLQQTNKIITPAAHKQTSK